MITDGLIVASNVDHDDHRTGDGHPEAPCRLHAFERGIVDLDRADALVRIDGRPATDEELEAVHHPEYLVALRALSDAGGGELDPDTPVSSGSWRTAVGSVGLGLAAIEALRDGRGRAAFVAPRPPGHHASADRGMGFCLLNNVAVVAAALARAGERVLIVDWDVHHGNGTQAIFWNDPNVMYASIHEWPTYPGTGRATETGGPLAPDLTVNIPLPAGATGDVVLAAFDHVVAPAVDAFAPGWVLISAGFDAHRDDPLADLALSAGDFNDLAERVLRFAPGPGRTIAFLEGGYDLDALTASVAATAAGLLGEARHLEPPTSGGPGREAVAHAADVRAEWQGAPR